MSSTAPTTSATKTITKTKNPASKSRRRKTKIEKEIARCQSMEKHLIPVSCMRRVVSEILKKHGESLRITKDAQEMLQAEAEATVVSKLRKANKLASIAKRDTVTADDLKNVSYFTES